MSLCSSIQHSQQALLLLLLLHHHQSPFSSSLSQTLLLTDSNNNMVKFSKQFEGQLIPEWKHAFVDYWQLKKDLKKLYLLKTDNNPATATAADATGTGAAAAASTFLSSIKKFSIFGHNRRDHGPIHVLFLSTSHNFPLFPFCMIVCVNNIT